MTVALRRRLVEVAEEVDHASLSTSRRHLHGRVALVGLDARVGVRLLHEEARHGDVAVRRRVMQRRAPCNEPYSTICPRSTIEVTPTDRV